MRTSVSFGPSAESRVSPPMAYLYCSLYGMIFILGWRKHKIVETFLLALGVPEETARKMV